MLRYHDAIVHPGTSTPDTRSPGPPGVQVSPGGEAKIRYRVYRIGTGGRVELGGGAVVVVEVVVDGAGWRGRGAGVFVGAVLPTVVVGDGAVDVVDVVDVVADGVDVVVDLTAVVVGRGATLDGTERAVKVRTGRDVVDVVCALVVGTGL